MSDNPSLRRSARLRSKPTVKFSESDHEPRPKKFHEMEKIDETSSEEEFDPEPKARKAKKPSVKKVESSVSEKAGKSKKQANKGVKKATKSSQPVKIEENVEQPMEIDELEALQDLPELNAPREWLNILEAGPSENVLPIEEENIEESSDEDWHEVQAPKLKAKKPAVEVRIEKKKSTEKEKEDKMKRLQLERETRLLMEDCHKLHFLVYLVHSRYQMICVKEFCFKYQKELHDLLDYDIFNDSGVDLDEKLEQFRARFTKTGNSLIGERSKEETIKRLYSILKDRVFQTNKDLTMAFIALFISAEIPCRLCIGFSPAIDLPSNKKAVTKKKAAEIEDGSSDEEKPSISKAKKKIQPAPKVAKLNYWAEYFDEAENDWIPVHPVNEEICNLEAIEKYAPFKYALGIDTDLNVLDITGWYARDFLVSTFRKSRLSDTWIQGFLAMPEFCSSTKTTMIEAQKLRNYLLSKPMPKIVSEFKNHPLYAIEKDLLKFEALYPQDIKPLGKIRTHDIYPRSAVCHLEGELNWTKLARSVREGEEPYKVVKARPKLNIPAEERVPLFLNTYGYWQTEPYVPPKVVDGKITRNEFGNIYMYQPQMVPENCVHLRQKGVLAMARSLDLEAVPAVVGWEFSGGRNHPTLDGCVVLAKDAEILSNACTEWLEIRTQKKAKVAEDRALQLWKRFVKGKFLLQKMKKRFNVE